jgi:hypothetical protein
MPPVELVLFDPIPGGVGSLGSALSPGLLEGVGEAPEDAQDRSGVGLLHPTFVFPVGDVEGVVGSILDAPTLLFQGQPLLAGELTFRTRGDQPGSAEFAFGTDASIDPGNLQGARQAQFLGLKGPGDNRPVFPASAPRADLLVSRGKGPPAGVVGRF